MSLLGRFGAGLLTMLTGPVMNWNVHPDMDEMLTPAKTASRPLTKPGSNRIGSDRIGLRIGSDRIGSDRIGLVSSLLVQKNYFEKSCLISLRLISVTVSFVSHSVEQTLNTLRSLHYV